MESMASKNRNCEEYDETFVFVELSGTGDTNFLSKVGDECKVLGLDTDKPVFEIGGSIFTGSYADALGTEVFFVEDDDKMQKGDGVEVIEAESDPEHKIHVPPLRYAGSSFKKLHLYKGFLTEKATEKDQPELGGESSPEEDEQGVSMETEDDPAAQEDDSADQGQDDSKSESDLKNLAPDQT